MIPLFLLFDCFLLGQNPGRIRDSVVIAEEEEEAEEEERTGLTRRRMM